MKIIFSFRKFKWIAPIVFCGLVLLVFYFSKKSNVSMLVAPFLYGEYYCDSAINNELVHNSDDAAFFCAAKGENASARINKTLDEIGPTLSSSGAYQLGYTMNIPLFRYYRKIDGKWVFDESALAKNLTTIAGVNRPVVLYLSSNHFIESNTLLAAELSRDRGFSR